MSDFAEYAKLLSTEVETVDRIGQRAVSWEEGNLPLLAACGPAHMEQPYNEFQESVGRLRKRPHLQERLKERLA